MAYMAKDAQNYQEAQLLEYIDKATQNAREPIARGVLRGEIILWAEGEDRRFMAHADMLFGMLNVAPDGRPALVMPNPLATGRLMTTEAGAAKAKAQREHPVPKPEEPVNDAPATNGEPDTKRAAGPAERRQRAQHI